MPIYHGRCHCGTLTLRYSTASEPASIRPRACDCSYCTLQGALYVSDPSGWLELASGAHKYRQGEERADFLSCPRCAVLLAVVYAGRGAVNARCLECFGDFGRPMVVSPAKLKAEEKLERWQAHWTPLS